MSKVRWLVEGCLGVMSKVFWLVGGGVGVGTKQWLRFGCSLGRTRKLDGGGSREDVLCFNLSLGVEVGSPAGEATQTMGFR